jgi:hypothetical protein
MCFCNLLKQLDYKLDFLLQKNKNKDQSPLPLPYPQLEGGGEGRGGVYSHPKH